MDIKSLTNNQLIQLFKEKGCNLTQIEKDFNLGKNAAGRLYNKRGINYKLVKEEWLKQQRTDYESNPKLCKQCGKPIPYEKKDNVFCSQSCSAIYTNTERGSKTRKHNRFCINCGKELVDDQVYNRYCCHACQHEYQYKQYIDRWKKGEETGVTGKYDVSEYIRRYLFDKYNSSCQLCGWNKVNPKSGKVPLQIHHIDGNCLNNKEENLQLLCPNCHSLTDTFGNLNQKSSRIYRKQKENTQNKD